MSEQTLKIGIFGASTSGLESARELNPYQDVFSIVCFFDNDSKKWGNAFHDCSIKNPSKENLAACDIILISSCYSHDIFKQILALGFFCNVAFSVEDVINRFHPQRHTQRPNKDSSLKLPPSQKKEIKYSSISSSPLVAFSACANNHTAYASTLAKSFLALHPKGRVTIFLIDKKSASIAYPDEQDPRIELIEVEALNIKDFNRLSFQYDVYELCTALRPHLVKFMLDQGHECIFMIDPDMLITAPFDSLSNELQSSSFLIFPHLVCSQQPVHIAHELSILKSGIYNCGLMSFRNCPETKSFLNWWQQRLDQFCFNDHDRGFFVDQKWLDFAPGLFPGCKVIQNPGYNVAYWNLHERTITRQNNQYLSNQAPLSCFHFSSMKPKNWESPLNRIQELSGCVIKDNEHLFSLCNFYRENIVQNGFLETYKTPYHYNFFDNGIEISKSIRRIYSHPEIHSKFKNPFKSKSPKSFFGWLNSRIDKESPITQLFSQLAQKNTLRQTATSQAIDIAVKGLIESLKLQNPLGLHDAFYNAIRENAELKTTNSERTPSLMSHG